MRAFVFTDESLGRHAGRFVWLEVNTEKRENAPVRKRFPVEALPTYLIVDPRDETVLLRWVGGATVPQLHAMLDEAATAYAGKATKHPADVALARADKLYGQGKNAEAAVAYREALAAAPPGWAASARATESLLFALTSTDAHAEAARVARTALPRLRKTASAANVAALGLDAALALAKEDTARAGLIAALERAGSEIAADATLPVAADDRSGLFIVLLSAREDAEDAAGAKAVAEAWAAFLEGAAARATSPDARAVFDPHRLSAYLELGQPERAIPMLEQSQRDLPDDYNPVARLAIAYRAMKKWPEALAASDRALAMAYGPRRLSLLNTRADIFAGMGDTLQARATLEGALAEARALPEGQRSEATLAALTKKLDTLR
jgi:tetratricopeptide (TPR) repeat protein